MSDTFRQTYTELTPEAKADMDSVKAKAVELMDLFQKAVPAEERSEKSRCMNIARTNLEQAVMWAVKGITV